MSYLSLLGVGKLLQQFANAVTAVAELNGHAAVVGTNLDYGLYVHQGTKPHVITARNAKALSWPGAAHPVRSVDHPGYAGNPFLTSALDDSKPEILARLETATIQAFGGASPAAMIAALTECGHLVEAKAKDRVNVRTGTLRRSILTEVR